MKLRSSKLKIKSSQLSNKEQQDQIHEKQKEKQENIKRNIDQKTNTNNHLKRKRRLSISLLNISQSYQSCQYNKPIQNKNNQNNYCDQNKINVDRVSPSSQLSLSLSNKSLQSLEMGQFISRHTLKMIQQSNRKSSKKKDNAINSNSKSNTNSKNINYSNNQKQVENYQDNNSNDQDSQISSEKISQIYSLIVKQEESDSQLLQNKILSQKSFGLDFNCNFQSCSSINNYIHNNINYNNVNQIEQDQQKLKRQVSFQHNFIIKKQASQIQKQNNFQLLKEKPFLEYLGSQLGNSYLQRQKFREVYYQQENHLNLLNFPQSNLYEDSQQHLQNRQQQENYLNQKILLQKQLQKFKLNDNKNQKEQSLNDNENDKKVNLILYQNQVQPKQTVKIQNNQKKEIKSFQPFVNNIINQNLLKQNLNLNNFKKHQKSNLTHQTNFINQNYRQPKVKKSKRVQKKRKQKQTIIIKQQQHSRKQYQICKQNNIVVINKNKNDNFHSQEKEHNSQFHNIRCYQTTNIKLNEQQYKIHHQNYHQQNHLQTIHHHNHNFYNQKEQQRLLNQQTLNLRRRKSIIKLNQERNNRLILERFLIEQQIRKNQLSKISQLLQQMNQTVEQFLSLKNILKMPLKLKKEKKSMIQKEYQELENDNGNQSNVIKGRKIRKI